jgi:4-hydroxy-tetrahydrodipicolinate reductase
VTTPLVIIGYGKMGRLVDQLAPDYGFDVRACFSRSNVDTLSPQTLCGATVAIEFSTPDGVPWNIRKLASLGLQTVCGTTGWYDQLPQIRSDIAQAGTALLYAANFSIGVNLFFEIASRAAALFADLPEYEAWGWEIHHSAKKDSPSGTLERLEQAMRAAGFTRAISLSANRAGTHFGTHEIGFDSPSDTITLRHSAKNREGFVRGALLAARWIAGKKGVFEFREVLADLQNRKSAVGS